MHDAVRLAGLREAAGAGALGQKSGQLAEPAYLRLALEPALLVQRAVRGAEQQGLGLPYGARHGRGSAATRSATVASSSASGTTRLASPIAIASSAKTYLAVAQISRARA